ncbi:MAG TPA: PfkB family carbohydrate kinase, partial [Verrucomicrobiae bacterium]
EALRTKLFPLAALITPNIPEAEAFTNRKIQNLDQMHEAASAMAENFGCPILLKGGHLSGKTSIDVLHVSSESFELTAPRMRGIKTHGTGCTYSAAITALLARGATLRESITLAKRFMSSTIENYAIIGKHHVL